MPFAEFCECRAFEKLRWLAVRISSKMIEKRSYIGSALVIANAA